MRATTPRSTSPGWTWSCWPVPQGPTSGRRGTTWPRAGRSCRAATPSRTSKGCSGSTREAQARGVPVVVGAGFSPGYTCVLARHAAGWFDEVDEIHVARSGTGGPACARHHHHALAGTALDWRDGGWQRAARRFGARAVLVPRPDRGAGLLPGGAARRPAAGPRLPGRRARHRPRGAPAGATGSPATCRCSAGRTRRASWAPCAWRCAVAEGGPRRSWCTGRSTARPSPRVRWPRWRRAGWSVASCGPARPASRSIADPVPFLDKLAGIGIRAAVFEGVA